MEVHIIVAILLGLIGLAAGVGLGYVLKQRADERKTAAAAARAEAIVAEAEATARQIDLEAKDAALAIRNEAEAETNRRRRELSRLEDRAQRRLEQLETRSESQEERERKLNQRQSQMDRRFNELEKAEGEYKATLERIAGMTQDEAREELLRRTEATARTEMARSSARSKANWTRWPTARPARW